MKNEIEITILMPVHNGENYLVDAIDSILYQTFEEFEFLIINDGSTDRSVEIIEKYNDSRIRLIHNESNIGIADTLNKGIEMAQGKYIARMDCDDIAFAERLEKQINFMKKNPEVGICGSLIEEFGIRDGICKYPIIDEEIKIHLLFYSSLAHPTLMFRKEFFNKYNLRYNSEFNHGEDYELWSRAKNCFKLANINEPLLKYRVHQTSISNSKKEYQDNLANSIKIILLKELDVKPSKEELKTHNSLICNMFENNNEYIDRVEQWILKLVEGNNTHKIYAKKSFNDFLGTFWFEVIKLKVNDGLDCWKKYWSSPLRKHIYNRKNTQKIITRSIINEFKNKNK